MGPQKVESHHQGEGGNRIPPTTFTLNSQVSSIGVQARNLGACLSFASIYSYSSVSLMASAQSRSRQSRTSTSISCQISLLVADSAPYPAPPCVFIVPLSFYLPVPSSANQHNP